MRTRPNRSYLALATLLVAPPAFASDGDSAAVADPTTSFVQCVQDNFRMTGPVLSAGGVTYFVKNELKACQQQHPDVVPARWLSIFIENQWREVETCFAREFYRSSLLSLDLGSFGLLLAKKLKVKPAVAEVVDVKARLDELVGQQKRTLEQALDVATTATAPGAGAGDRIRLQERTAAMASYRRFLSSLKPYVARSPKSQ